MKIIGCIVATIVLWAYAALLNGWAIQKLWAWFIVTTFGAPALSIPAAIGLGLLVSYLTQEVKSEKPKEKYLETLSKGLVLSTVKPLVCVGVGSVVRLWL